MKLRNLLNEEIKPPKGNGIIIFDIDDTLVQAKGLYVYQKKDGKEIKLTPPEFANLSAEEKSTGDFDFRDFRSGSKMYKSIIQGTPIIKNLRMLDAHVRAGWKVGFLTARGVEKANLAAIRDWIRFKDKNGNLSPITISFFNAVNDEGRLSLGGSSAERKAKALEILSKEYDIVKFVDDDKSFIDAARKVLPKKNVIHVPH